MSFRKLVQWIREEFEAAPELRLNVREAAAFLGLDLAMCERVLVHLFRAGALRRYASGRYGGASSYQPEERAQAGQFLLERATEQTVPWRP